MEASTVGSDHNNREIKSQVHATIDERFLAAVEIVTNLPTEGPVTISTDEKLVFYSLYKQATVGPCNIASPSFWNVVEKFKWEAWNRLGAMDPSEAKTAYVQRLLKIIHQVYKDYNTDDWMCGDLHERLLPKLAIIGLLPSSREPINKGHRDDSQINEEGVMLNGCKDNAASDVEYMDAEEEGKRDSRVMSSASSKSECKTRDRSYSSLRRHLATIEKELKVISQQIANLTVGVDQRSSRLRSFFEKALEAYIPIVLIGKLDGFDHSKESVDQLLTVGNRYLKNELGSPWIDIFSTSGQTFHLLVPSGIPWKTIVVLLVWPFIAHVLFRKLRKHIGF